MDWKYFPKTLKSLHHCILSFSDAYNEFDASNSYLLKQTHSQLLNPLLKRIKEALSRGHPLSEGHSSITS